MKSELKFFTLIFAGLALQGCATFMNGTVQSVKVDSDRPVEIILNNTSVGMAPKVVELSRKREHTLEFLDIKSGETTAIEFYQKTSNWIWGNICFYLYGIGGVGIDYFLGGMYRLIPINAGSGKLSRAGVTLSLDVDPWTTGEWHASMAYYFGAKVFPKSVVGVEQTYPQLAFQLVVGKNTWPVDVLIDGYFYSAAQEIDNHNLLDVGIRKTFLSRANRVHPYLGGGLNWMSHSTQNNTGFPLGVWTRAGVDIRTGQHFFIGPYLGYSKYETLLSGVNTGGAEGGMMVGMVW